MQLNQLGPIGIRTVQFIKLDLPLFTKKSLITLETKVYLSRKIIKFLPVQRINDFFALFKAESMNAKDIVYFIIHNVNINL